MYSAGLRPYPGDGRLLWQAIEVGAGGGLTIAASLHVSAAGWTGVISLMTAGTGTLTAPTVVLTGDGLGKQKPSKTRASHL